MICILKQLLRQKSNWMLQAGHHFNVVCCALMNDKPFDRNLNPSTLVTCCKVKTALFGSGLSNIHKVGNDRLIPGIACESIKLQSKVKIFTATIDTILSINSLCCKCLVFLVLLGPHHTLLCILIVGYTPWCTWFLFGKSQLQADKPLTESHRRYSASNLIVKTIT